jgi:hypothetical protein
LCSILPGQTGFIRKSKSEPGKFNDLEVFVPLVKTLREPCGKNENYYAEENDLSLFHPEKVEIVKIRRKKISSGL